MKNIILLCFLHVLSMTLFVYSSHAQKIAFQTLNSFSNTCLEKGIIKQIQEAGLDAESIDITELRAESSQGMYTFKGKIKNESQNLQKLGFTHLLLPIEFVYPGVICESTKLERYNKTYLLKLKILELSTLKNIITELIINTSSGANEEKTLENSSNISEIIVEISNFINSYKSISEVDKKDESNSATVSSQVTILKPTIMVLPKKIDPSKFVNGEYLLTVEEKMMISSLKNKFEERNYTTYGFESTMKRVMENRLTNGNVKEDIKSKILEMSGIDFFVEFEEVSKDYSNSTYDIKIRNYSTSEDVATDIRTISSKATAEEYKQFASAFLNEGAISKLNAQFSILLKDGRKVSVLFTISPSSQLKFSNELSGKKLGVHINSFMQNSAYRGIVDLDSESDLRKEVRINIPMIDPKTGQKYQTTTFAEEIIQYLKSNARVECDRVVSRQMINIVIK